MPKVTNKSLGISVECNAGEKFREVAMNQNLGVPFGCESGICSTCLINIGAGLQNLSPKTEQEEMTLDARGATAEQRLGCQCVVNGDVEFEFPN